MKTQTTINDPVLLAIIQKQLDHITLQMGTVMVKTARSPIFSQSHDFSCFLSNSRGETIAQADGLPIHSGGGGFAVRALLRDLGKDISDGDVFILSDPYEAGGNHLPDWTIIRPVFAAGVLAGFCTNRAHQSDIGGGAAGTYNAAATEIFHEGIRLPVLKLYESGKRRDDLWKLLLLNSRCPDLLDGDLAAMVGSTRIGAERMSALFIELGADRAEDYLDAVLAHGERSMRQAVRDLPDGVWKGADVSDNDCFELRDVETHVTLTIKGDVLTFDFTGSSPQIRGFKNSSLANTYSSVYVAVSSFLDKSIPRNEGAYRCVKIIAPEGTVVNAKPPAPLTMCTVFPATDIMNACWRALEQTDPERACASWGKLVHGISAGRQPDGRMFVMYHWHGQAGGGAVKGRDGFPMTSAQMTLGGMSIPNVETYEQSYPCRILRQEFRLDGGGAGEYRGGTGVEYEAIIFTPSEHHIRAEGGRRPTGLGCVGGLSGAMAEISVFELDSGRAVDVPPYGAQALPPARFKILGSGGGGWGYPKARKPEVVLRDVRDGVVSVQVARDIYGVVISQDGKAVVSATPRSSSV
ncbi:hydantoinase B/oxoprolinase family protein [Mesorhizobium sp. M1348]|uniref:hydantoinase B/oxoprolinase family protein n=1 Tax=Mesorhizobium sp. M1348 TaxID=2957089 RepID=UPI00333571C7